MLPDATSRTRPNSSQGPQESTGLALRASDFCACSQPRLPGPAQTNSCARGHARRSRGSLFPTLASRLTHNLLHTYVVKASENWENSFFHSNACSVDCSRGVLPHAEEINLFYTRPSCPSCPVQTLQSQHLPLPALSLSAHSWNGSPCPTEAHSVFLRRIASMEVSSDLTEST